jgi:rhodanese-related sulfurtransferase
MPYRRYSTRRRRSYNNDSYRPRRSRGLSTSLLMIGLVGAAILIVVGVMSSRSGGSNPTATPGQSITKTSVGEANPTTLPGQSVPEISVGEAHQKFLTGTLFLDVRTPGEWESGIILNSVLISLDDLPARYGELPRDREIVVVCRSGVRSHEGATILQNAGFTQISSMKGGILAWSAAGYPLTSNVP